MGTDTKRQVFFSFHYDADNWRAQEVRNMGVVEEERNFSPNEWERVRLQTDEAIKIWIDSQLQMRSCLVVLVGSETAHRRWVQYEICQAWNLGKGVVGVYIHNLKDAQGRICPKGPNPFTAITLSGGGLLSDLVECYEPSAVAAYSDIKKHLPSLIEQAISLRSTR